MYKLISVVRELRQNGAFKISTRLLVVLLMVAGLWVATMPISGALPKVNDKIMHMAVFFGFALLVDLTSARKPFWLWKGVPLLSYGLLIEVSQSFTTYRLFEWADIAADGMGIIIYYSAKYWIKWMATIPLKT